MFFQPPDIFEDQIFASVDGYYRIRDMLRGSGLPSCPACCSKGRNSKITPEFFTIATLKNHP
jgi:hypothetical protein